MPQFGPVDPVRRRRRAGGSLPGPGSRPAAAQSHAGAPPDRTDANLQGLARGPRPSARCRSINWKHCWSASAIFCAIFSTSRRSTSIRFWPAPKACIALDARVLLGGLPPPDWRLSHILINTPPPGGCRTARTSLSARFGPKMSRLIEAHHRALSEQSIRMRFFGMVKTLSRDSLIRLCHLDYAREMALVAERQERRRKAGDHRRVALST